MTDPKVSVVIVNCNGKDYLLRCIDSILESKTNNLEVIAVDNGSTDGSVEAVRNKFPDLIDNKLKVIALDKNYGPSKARNEGVKIAKGEYLGFLDNDTIVHEDWAEEAISQFEQNPKVGILQCKLLLAKERNKLDYVGEYLGQNGFLVQTAKAGEIDNGQYDDNTKILAAKSAGMFIRKSTFDHVGGFDEDYFIYVEETDLGWRSWLYGYENIFVYKSIVYHEYGTSSITLGKMKSNYNAKFHGSKNYILTLFKNLETLNIVKILIPHIVLWAGLGVYNLLKGRVNEAGWIFSGILWNLKNLPRSIQKRRVIQSKRVKKDKELFNIFMKKMSLFYFVNKATVKQKIGNAESF